VIFPDDATALALDDGHIEVLYPVVQDGVRGRVRHVVQPGQADYVRAQELLRNTEQRHASRVGKKVGDLFPSLGQSTGKN